MGRGVIYLKVVQALREEIRAGVYNGKAFPSEAMLMRKHKIGRQTAVRVLNALAGDGLVVRRKGSGTYISPTGRRATGRIGLIIHGSDYCELFTPVAKRISQLCQKNGYTLMFGDVSSDCTASRIKKVLELADNFVQTGLDGVIIQPLELAANAEQMNRRLVDKFTAAQIPVALFDSDIVSEPARSEFDLVAVNHFEVGWQLAAHLRKVGAKRILYLAEKDHAPCVQARQLGVKVGSEGLALAGKAAYAKSDDVAAIKRIIAREKPDAIACYNDRYAALLLQTLAKLGKRVPQDIRVAGFDDVQYAKLTSPQLTAMHQPCDELAQTVFELLLQRIRKPNLPPRSIILNAPLVVRGSTDKSEL